MNYLKETKMLDYKNESIQNLISRKNWVTLPEKDKILSTYNFVRDNIEFGYNTEDTLSASQVLFDGYGQCNTKGTLFMALLRALDIPCRIHGFLIDKEMQKGAMKGFYFRLAPKNIIHSWIEVQYKDEWLDLEGFILDAKYLNNLQEKFSDQKKSFCGYGVATRNFQNPPIEWNENNTYIQSEGITKDLGVFASPDELFESHHQDLNIIKKFLYIKIIRHLMNKNIRNIRN